MAWPVAMSLAEDALVTPLRGIANAMEMKITSVNGAYSDGYASITFEEPNWNGVGLIHSYIVCAYPWDFAEQGLMDRRSNARANLLALQRLNNWRGSVQRAVDEKTGRQYDETAFTSSEWNGTIRAFSIGNYAFVCAAMSYPGMPDEATYAGLEELIELVRQANWPQMLTLEDAINELEEYSKPKTAERPIDQLLAITAEMMNQPAASPTPADKEYTLQELEEWGHLIMRVLAMSGEQVDAWYGEVGEDGFTMAWNRGFSGYGGDIELAESAPKSVQAVVNALHAYAAVETYTALTPANSVVTYNVPRWPDAANLLLTLDGIAQGNLQKYFRDLYVACCLGSISTPTHYAKEGQTDAERLEYTYNGSIQAANVLVRRRILTEACEMHPGTGLFITASEMLPLVNVYIKNNAVNCVGKEIWEAILTGSKLDTAQLIVIFSKLEAEGSGSPVKLSLKRVDEVLAKNERAAALYKDVSGKVAGFAKYQKQFLGGLRMLENMIYDEETGLSYTHLYQILDADGAVLQTLLAYAGEDIEEGDPTGVACWDEDTLKEALGEMELPAQNARKGSYILLTGSKNEHEGKRQSSLSAEEITRQLGKIRMAIGDAADCTSNPLSASFALRYEFQNRSSGTYSRDGSLESYLARLSVEVYNTSLHLEAIDLATGEVFASKSFFDWPGDTIEVPNWADRKYYMPLTLTHSEYQDDLGELRGQIRTWIEAGQAEN